MESLWQDLRRWLRSLESPGVASVISPDESAQLAPSEWLALTARGANREISAREFADTLLDVARHGNGERRSAVLDGLSTASASWWLQVDESLRKQWWGPGLRRELAAPLLDDIADLLGLLVAACCCDGHIRQAAVTRLSDRPHPAAAAALALRACDWVPQVRDEARRACERRLSGGGDDATTLPTFAEIGFALGNRSHGGWLAGKLEHLLQDLPLDGLEPLLTAADRRVRRVAFRIAVTRGVLDSRRLVTAASTDTDLPIRALCARAVISSDPDPSTVRVLLSSRVALVRTEALHHLAITGSETDLAIDALADRHPLVRATAQAALRRAGGDPAGHYRHLVAATPPRPGAIAGLGETGVPADAALLRTWLAHPRPRGRVETIRALRRLGGINPAELIPLLQDSSGSVTRQAVSILRHHTGALDPTRLKGLLSPANPPHVRMAGYRLLQVGDAWQRLEANLSLVHNPDYRLRSSARASIAAWLDHEAATTYSTPTPQQCANLDTLIERAGGTLSEHRILQLRFHAGLTRKHQP